MHTCAHARLQVAGKVCMETLHWHNSPLIMSQCGSKGSPINIAQVCFFFRLGTCT